MFTKPFKTECRWTGPEVAILGADQKERGLRGREWGTRYQKPPPQTPFNAVVQHVKQDFERTQKIDDSTQIQNCFNLDASNNEWIHLSKEKNGGGGLGSAGFTNIFFQPNA